MAHDAGAGGRRIAQCDPWFPEPKVPVAPGQERVPPVLVMGLGFSRFMTAVMRATGTFVARAESVILFGPPARPASARTTWPAASGVKAAHAGYPVLFGTAGNWIARLQAALRSGRLEPS